MTFLHPSALWLLLAGLGVVILYLVRRRRRSIPVSSIELWAEAIRADAPRARVQRLQSLLSLLVELLVVAAIGLAAARPVRPIALPARRNLGIVLDVSPTLDARDAAGVRRFERAVAAARLLVEGLEPQDSVLLATTHRGGTVVSPLGAPSSDGLEALGATDLSVESDPLRAVERVSAILAGSESGAARLVLVTDLATPGARLAADSKDVVTLPVTDDASSAGIVDFAVDPKETRDTPRSVRFTIRNYGPSATSRKVRLVERGLEALVLGEQTISLEPEGESRSTLWLPKRFSGEIALSLEPSDAFPADDLAVARVTSHAPSAVLVLARGGVSIFLHKALYALEPRIDLARSAVATPERYEELAGDYSLAIFDRCSPPGPLRGPAILIGSDAVPAPLRVTGRIDARAEPAAVEVSREDPVVRNLDLDGLVVGASLKLDVPAGAEASVLLESGGDPLLLIARSAPSFAFFAFDLESSNLGKLVAFPVLFSHLVDAIGPEVDCLAPSIRPGDVLEPERDLGFAVDRPEIRTEAGALVATLETTAGGWRVPWLESDVYRIGSKDRSASVAVNLARPEWSDIRCGEPKDSRPIAEVANLRVREGKQELWLVFATAALAGLALHWFIFGSGAPRR